MVIFPHCKINIGLRVVRKRTDGYHDLQTVFYPLPIRDVLEVTDSVNNAGSSLTISGFSIQGELTNNLCLKAYYLLKKDFSQLPSIHINLYKNIPMGAGLGGGSSDGAFTLRLLNNRFQLKLSDKELLRYSLELGSDCPFFITDNPAYAEGRGELMENIPLDLSGYSFLLISPGIHISTAEAFSQIKPTEPVDELRSLVTNPIQTWKNTIFNDFEQSVFNKHPEIEKIKTVLYEQGAVYASMTGTGSSVYGIFEKDHLPEKLFDGIYRTDRVR